jgi:aspartate/methionine/tyrosine aminotransferase
VACYYKNEHALIDQRAAFTPKTKVIIINTPHNPSGKVFTRAELETLAEICIEKNVLVLADEVVRVFVPIDPIAF